jgi:hypothetical protein
MRGRDISDFDQFNSQNIMQVDTDRQLKLEIQLKESQQHISADSKQPSPLH